MEDVHSDTAGSLAKRALPNVLLNFLPFVLTAVVGLFMVPFFIRKLGIVGYSVIPLALSMTGYVTLISDAVSSSIGRYLAVAIQRNDHEEAGKVYNTAFFGLLRIVAAAIPVIVVLSLLSPSIFNITWSDPLTVQFFFLTMFGSMIVVSWSSLFLMVLFASNRLDLIGLVRSVNIIIQFGLVILLLTYVAPNIIYIGISYLLASLAFMLLGWMLMKRVQPGLRVRRSGYDGTRFKDMAGLGGWTIINNLGNLLFIQMSLIMVNVLYGSESGGNFGIVVSVVTMVISSTIIFSEVFAPPIYHFYSTRDYERMNFVSRFSVKAAGLVLGFPLAFVFVFIGDILGAWVGSQFLFLSPTIMLMIAFMVGIQSIVPAFTLALAYKKMRVPAIFSVLFGFLNIGLILIFHLTTDFGLMGVAVAWTVSMFIKNCIFMPWYIAKATDAPIHSYFTPLLYGYAYFAISVIGCSLISHLLGLTLGILGIVIAFLVLFSAYMLMVVPTLKKNERSMLMSTLPSALTSSRFIRRILE